MVFHTMSFTAFFCPAISTPAYWCIIFQSRIFRHCILVLHVLFLYFQPLQYDAAFSSPEFSCLAFSAASPSLCVRACATIQRHRLIYFFWCSNTKHNNTRMWANAQRDGRPADHRWRPLFNTAKFGWRLLLNCRAVTLPRLDTRWNMMGCPKPANRFQPLVGRSSPYCGDICRTYCCLVSFFSDCR